MEDAKEDYQEGNENVKDQRAKLLMKQSWSREDWKPLKVNLKLL